MSTLDETVETVDERPATSATTTVETPSGLRSSLHSGTLALTGTQPSDALRLEEVERTRKFMLLIIALCVAIGGVVPLLSGDPTMKTILIPAVALTGLLAALLYVHFRDPQNYTTLKIFPFALWTGSMTFFGVAFFGMFSPACAMVVMGIYFFSRTQSVASAVAIIVWCVFLQAAISGALIFGVVDDPGMYPMPDLPTWELLVAVGLIEMIYIGTFWIARSTRRSTEHAIRKLQVAARKIEQREALFQEVRRDLDEALKVGGPGRYTDNEFGPYRVGTLIGRGAMGEVYEAVHLETGEPAAVKLLHPHVVDNPKHVTRFFREAQAASALASPHVVKIFAMSDSDELIPYMIMERLHGDDLAHHLRNKRRLPRRDVLQMLEQVGSVVDLARHRGIVHRDLKPQNLLLAEYPEGPPVWKILDFGVSKLGEGSGTLTQGNVVGTPVYMAPEQARGVAVDYRADLYALAAIAYRCLTGRPPMSGGDVPTILYNVVYDMPPRPSYVSEVYPDVDFALAVGLAKRPDDRYASATELVDALRLAFRGELDDEIKRRAIAVLNAHPWGSAE